MIAPIRGNICHSDSASTVCVGNRLGEMQLNVLWKKIMKRFDRIDVVGDPTYLRSNFIHGITELP